MISTLAAQPSFPNNRFGSGTRISADGQTLVVAAPGDLNNPQTGAPGDPANGSFGAVHVFRRHAAGGWALEGYLQPQIHTSAGGALGIALAISADGNTIAIGDPGDPGRGAGIGSDPHDIGSVSINIGAVWLYVRRNSAWTLQEYFKPPFNDPAIVFSWGQAVALNDDGNWMVVGAQTESSDARGINGDGNNSASVSSGAAWIYQRDAGAKWHQRAYVKASNADIADTFGIAVAISGDGRTVAVGASGEASAANSINGDPNDNSLPQVGAAYVYERDANEAWSETAYVKAYENFGRNSFGQSIALDASGTLLAVGAPTEFGQPRSTSRVAQDDPSIGRAYLFRKSNGQWRRVAALTASNAGAGDAFGNIVALSNDGRTLAVSAPREDGGSPGLNGSQDDDSQFNSGAVYLFSPGASDTWPQTTYVKAPHPCACALIGGFTRGLSLDGTGQTLVVGDPAHSGETGNVYVYE